jgi:large subunit ribosomal protein L32
VIRIGSASSLTVGVAGGGRSILDLIALKPRPPSRPVHQWELAMVPKKKTSKARKRKRRSHHALRDINYSVCPGCNSAKLPHAACSKCGYHFGRTALEISKKKKES